MAFTDNIKEFFTGEPNITTLQGLFHETLKDVYYAEQQITEALPKMADAATSSRLKQALNEHLVETREQVNRLEHVFHLMGVTPKTRTCEAIQGLIEEGEEIMDEAEGSVLDAGLIAVAQAVEHYEMARYGSLVAWAKQLGMRECATLLEQTLSEEKHADSLLNQLAEQGINAAATTSAGSSAHRS